MGRHIRKRHNNYLDYVPFHDTACECVYNEPGQVIVVRHNKGIYNKIAQLIFSRPELSYVRLDDMGSYVWGLIDGQRTVYDIALKVSGRYGQDAEPLYDRLVQYMKILSEQGIIIMKCEI